MREEIAKLSNAGAAPPFSISPIFRSRGCNTASSRLHRKANRGAGDVSPRRCPKLKRLARAQRSARRSSASCHGPFQVGTALDGYKVTGFDIDRPHKTLRGVGLGHFAQRTSSRAWESADFTETDFALFWNSARPFLVNQSELAVGLEPRGLDLTRSLRFHPRCRIRPSSSRSSAETSLRQLVPQRSLHELRAWSRVHLGFDDSQTMTEHHFATQPARNHQGDDSKTVQEQH